MPNVVRKGWKEEGPEGCEQEIVRRVEEGLGEELGELKADRSDIDDVTNFIWPITPRILAQFPRPKIHRKALKKTFQMMPKMCQSDQYSLRYQLISAGY